MAKIKTYCALCGETSKSSEEPTICPVCKTNLADPGETVLKSTYCRIIPEGATAQTVKKGILFLTDSRLFWLKRPAGNLYRRGLCDVIIEAIFPKQKELVFSFQHNEITSIEIDKLGPFKMLTLTARGKKVVLDVKAKERDEWLDAVKKLLQMDTNIKII